MKKICTKLWFLIEDFPRSPSPVRGFWKSPWAAHRALGDFQNPLRAQGFWMKIPLQKPEFSIYIFSDSCLKFKHYLLTSNRLLRSLHHFRSIFQKKGILLKLFFLSISLFSPAYSSLTFYSQRRNGSGSIILRLCSFTLN